MSAWRNLKLFRRFKLKKKELVVSLNSFHQLVVFNKLLRTFARKFSSRWIFLKFLLQSNNELLVSVKQSKLGVTDFVSEIKRVENYPDFEKSAHVLQHALQGYIVENIEGESTEANDLSHIL